MTAITAVITGASRGIGRAIAERLATDYEAKLLLTYRSRVEEAEAVKATCEAAGAEVILHQCDLAEAGAGTAVVEACLDQLGGIDAVVHNAGITDDTLVLQMGDEAWSRVMAVNVTSAFEMARAAARPMLLNRHGRIVHLSSVSARRPNRGQANYAASKGAVEAFTRALAVELAPKGITVNAVAPGIIETEMSAFVRDKAGKDLKKAVPMRRFGQPGEIAGLVSFLVGPDAGYLTGQVIGVDGGVGL
ncbi:MAG: SDR family oxidoreductase [Bradymonadia bacterium]